MSKNQLNLAENTLTGNIISLIPLLEKEQKAARKKELAKLRSGGHPVIGCVGVCLISPGLLVLASIMDNPRPLLFLGLFSFVAFCIYSLVGMWWYRRAGKSSVDATKIEATLASLKGLQSLIGHMTDLSIKLDLSENMAGQGPRHLWLSLKGEDGSLLEVTRWTRKKHENKTESRYDTNSQSMHHYKVDYEHRFMKDTVSLSIPAPESTTRLEKELNGKVPIMETVDYGRKDGRMHVTVRTQEVDSSKATSALGISGPLFNPASAFGSIEGLFDENTARRLFGALKPSIQESCSPAKKAEALNFKNEIVEKADHS